MKTDASNLEKLPIDELLSKLMENNLASNKKPPREPGDD